MSRVQSKAFRVTTVLLVLLSLTVLPGCTGAILDTVYGTGLDLISGSLFGVGSFTLFGEEPPALIFNSLLISIGGGGAGGGHNH